MPPSSLQNVVGDTRLRLWPENVEMNLFLIMYSLRAINCKIDQLKTPPDEYLFPNSLNRDYTDDESDNKNMVTESDEEDSEIEFTDQSDEEYIL